MVLTEITKSKHSRNFLINEYLNKHRSALSIAKEIGVGETTIFRWLEFYRIKRRTSYENQHAQGFKEPAKEELLCLHCDQHKSLNEIAKIYKISWTTVKRWFKKHQLRVKSISEIMLPKEFIKPSRKELIALYYNKNMTTIEIGKKLGVDRGTIVIWFHEQNIQLKKKWSENKIIEEIKRINGEESNLSSRYIRLKHSGLYEASVKYLGSWKKALSIAGYNHEDFNRSYKYICQDGTRVMSVYEMEVANWLYSNKITYEYEPKYPKNQYYKRNYRADFRVGKFIIEVTGLMHREDYRNNFEKKNTQFMMARGTGSAVFRGEDYGRYEPYINKSTKEVIVIVEPKNKTLSSKEITRQLGFLIPLFSKKK